MKKTLLFLTLSFIYLISSTTIVNASTDSFYEAEYIDNIYMVRYDKSTGTKYYQKARTYRRTSDGKLAYCLQPFIKFNPSNNTYETVSSLPEISDEVLNRITDIIGFGYNHAGKNDLKWYAVTQLMIWQAVEPNSEFYFTDSLNGNKITSYDDEIQVINGSINESYTMPSFNNQTFYGVVGKPLTIKDTNKIIGFFGKSNNDITINSNDDTITILKNKPGCYNETFTRHFNSSNPILFYYNPNSQHLATVGSSKNRIANVKFCINELKLKIKKIDADTKSIISSGEGSLKDTVFTLYNNKMEKITDLTLDENMEINLSSNDYDINYGTYYLKESKSGTGYLPNDRVYEINFTTDNPTIELIIENKIIEKEIIIKKLYGDGKLMQTEANITFEIYDKDNNLIKSITTDQNGLAKITLPYGHYKIVQTNTTDGYTMIKPFEIFISDLNKDYYYTINDYKIPETPKEETPKKEEKISIKVPNTGTDYNNYPLLTLILPIYLIVKKKFS